MAKNKVIYGGNVLIDLTNDTVNANALLSGYTAHDRAGDSINGAVSFVTYYTGSTAPSDSLGSDGDIYLQITS